MYAADRFRASSWLLISASVFVCAEASAQAITDGDSTFNLPAANTAGAAIRTGADGGLNAVFTAGGDATDQLFQQWWWFRAGGGTREFGLSNRTGNTAVGNTLRLDYSEPDGVRAVLTYVLTDGSNSPASANIAAELQLFNITDNPLNLAVFCYLDYDLEGAASDAATLLEPGRIRMSDVGGFAGEFLGVDPNAYQVTAWAVLRGLLADAAVTNLNNTGLPFAAADFTGAFQWNLSIPAGGSTTIRAAFSLNMPADAGGDCPGDFDDNGARDLQDLAILLSGFGTSAAGDMDGDGDTDLQDLAFLLSVFGAAC